MTIHIEPRGHHSHEPADATTNEQTSTLRQHRIIAWLVDFRAHLLTASFVGLLIMLAGGGPTIETALGAAAYLALTVWASPRPTPPPASDARQ